MPQTNCPIGPWSPLFHSLLLISEAKWNFIHVTSCLNGFNGIIVSFGQLYSFCCDGNGTAQESFEVVGALVLTYFVMATQSAFTHHSVFCVLGCCVWLNFLWSMASKWLSLRRHNDVSSLRQRNLQAFRENTSRFFFIGDRSALMAPIDKWSKHVIATVSYVIACSISSTLNAAVRMLGYPVFEGRRSLFSSAMHN